MLRAVALALTILTGFSGLVYEVAWQKYLAILLGSHAEATAAVLAIFLGGLALGYALFGGVTRRRLERSGVRGLLRLYGGVECGIGAYALAFPALFGVVRALSTALPGDGEGLGFAFDVVLTAGLLGPPTLLMGATIPVLTQALPRDLEQATRVHAWVYGFNTAGAFAGALAGGFVLVPWLGLDGVLRAMALVNLGAGAIFFGLGARAASSPVAVPGRGEPAPRVTSTAAYAAVALLGGFAMMALQTVLNRIGGLAFGSSHFTFSMVVAVFVLCIALGSFAVSALSRIPPWLIVGSQWALVASLALLYFQLPDATYWAFVLRSHFGDADADFGAFQLAAFGWALAVLALPVGLSGATLPLLFHHLRREVGDLGAVAGRLYSWNTLGSLLGALLGGYVLLFWLDLHHVHQIALASLSIAAGILTARVLRVRGVLAAAVVVPVLAAIAAFPAWDPTRLSAGLFRERASGPLEIRGADEFFESLPFPEILFHDDDPTATVAVKMLRKGVTRPGLAIVTNGKIDGHLIIDYATMALAALVPALVAENPRRGFVIGYGTGVTAGELASIHSVEEVVVAEISPGVIAAAPYFDVGNLRASKSPRVRIVRGDAYRSLLRAPGRWDVIVSEPSNPWVTGVEMLYSIEFLQAARNRLTPGGVYGQWFHLYETDAPVVELVLRNYAAVFPHISVWFTKGPDLLLLGMDRADRALDVEALVERFRQPDYTSAFKRAWIGSPAELFAHELLPIGVVHAAELEGDLHTLRHPVLSHRAARAFFRRGNARLPRLAGPASAEVGARHSLLARYLETFDGVEVERALGTAARETCNAAQAVPCTTLLAHWMHEHPASRRLANARKALSGAAHTAKIDRVAELFAAAGDRPGAVREVRERTRLYARYYHHAVPFDRGSLETAWARCTPTTECLEARRRAERKLGPLGSP